MSPGDQTLPVLAIAQTIAARLGEASRLVLTAPTGSGKTTQVPQIVHRAGLLRPDQAIVVLQPRRLATRLVAQRVAHEMGSAIGGLVGWQTRHESRVSAASRIIFMTEGLLLRQLQRDRDLRAVGAVILDEFHERSLAADMILGLVMALQDRQVHPRSDLKLMVMSATLDAQRVAERLRCGFLETGGRLHPVEVRHAERPPAAREEPWDRAAAALEGLVRAESPTPGDVLIFMPGMYEINRTIEACRRRLGDDAIRCFALHGALPPAQQDAAVAPLGGADRGRRKVIVATNVAQTSITIEGVTAVIDSGLARVHRHDAQRAINVLRLEPISQASADQRAGRAGRTAPGTCIRLWTARDHAQRPAHDEPEIMRLELSEAVLQLKDMGVSDPRTFPWLDAPPGDALAHAEELLVELHAVDDRRRITALGRRMAGFPAHPRLARMMIEAADRGVLDRAVTWAAIIAERDVLSQPRQSVLLQFIEPDEPPSDLAARERLFERLKRGGFEPGSCQALGASPLACREIDQTIRILTGACDRAGLARLRDGGAVRRGSAETAELIGALLTAYADHVAVRLDPQRPHGAMPGRRKVMIDPQSVVRQAGPLVALHVTHVGRRDDATTNLAMCSAIDAAWLEGAHPQRIQIETVLEYNPASQAVEQVESRRYRVAGAPEGLEIARVTRPPSAPQRGDAADLLAHRIIENGLGAGAPEALRLKHWDQAVEQWIWRTRFVAGFFPERGLIAYDADDLQVIVREIVGDAWRFSQVRESPCLDAVKSAFGHDDQRFVERMAPESIALPGGRRLRIEYFADQPPRGRARIQELYDLIETPRLAGGRHALLVEILGPNQRPVQLTTDLRGFWERLYPELKKELKRRYPRHEWR